MFLFETVIEECVDAVGRFIARRYGWSGCLLSLAAIALAIALLIWWIA